MKKIIAFLFLLLFVLAGVARTIRIYAVDDKDFIFLGTLSGPYDRESIFYRFGTYGSRFNSKSIWNRFGKYGSKYNSSSPWNEYTRTPPVMLDDNYQFVGYFTVRENKCNRDLVPMMRYIKENFEDCADDPSELYEKFFR